MVTIDCGMLIIPGSLIKLVYFSRHEDRLINNRRTKSVKEKFGLPTGIRRSYPILGGRLHFVKFETHKINECLDFINSKQLHRGGNLLFVVLTISSFSGRSYPIINDSVGYCYCQ